MQNKYLFETAIILFTKQMINYSGKQQIMKTVFTILSIKKLININKSGNMYYYKKIKKNHYSKKIYC